MFMLQTMQKPNSCTYNFVEISQLGHNLESSILRFPYTMFTLKTSFKPLFVRAKEC